jgi:TonB-linked SusC/RagA family outer membrane protein
MKKSIPNERFCKICRIMKITGLVLTVICSVSLSLLAKETLAQGPLNKQLSIDIKGETLENAFTKISEKINVSFSYIGNTVDNIKKVNLVARNEKLKDVLDRMLKNYQLKYTVFQGKIIIQNEEYKREDADNLINIKGRVFDDKEPPNSLPGVVVKIKNKEGQAITDANGNFEIKVHKYDVLVFIYVGYNPLEYTINNSKDNITIALQENVTKLDQIIITGYTERKIKHIANAISVINVATNIDGKPITQLSQALQGGVTGLTVTQSSGLPGGDAATIKIRGISTLGTTNPLVLVDGVPTNINDIDPVTVESITVLKDAAASSIYGSRAANGVILVTTRRGQTGQTNIIYNGFAGYETPSYLPSFVDAPTYMTMVNQAQANIGAGASYTPEAIQKTKDGTDPLLYPNTDWKKLVLKNQAFEQQHTVAVSGGTSQARFFVNGSYLSQDAIIKSTSLERYALRANTSITLKKNLSMYLDLSMARSNQARPIRRFANFQDGDGAGYILYNAFRIPPNIVAKYPVRADGYRAYGSFAEMLNPVAELEQGGLTQSRVDNISINFQPQWEIVPGLKLKGQYLFRTISTGNIESRDGYNFLDYYTNNLIYQYTSLHNSGIYKTNYQYISATLDYNRTFNKNTIYALGGVTRETDNNDPSIQFSEATLSSYFAKVNYIYDDKYLFESTMRADGSSKFGPGHKWGYFPSGAIGWNIYKEKFLQGAKFLTNLKLRASYGLLGNNQGIGLYKYQSTVAGNGTESVIGNPDITWEKVKMLDIGADVAFFKNELSMTFDWYNKTTKDILLNAPLSYSSGIGPQPINAGVVRNKGWEISATYATHIAKDLSTSFSAGYSYYKNTILNLKNGPYIGANTINDVGHPIGSNYGYRTDGLLQQKDIDAKVPMIGSGSVNGPSQVAGDIKYLDLNNDGTITGEDLTIIGNPNPQGNYFFNMRFAYKGFDFETLLNGFTKTDVFYTGRYILPLNLSGGGGTPMVWQQDTWTPTNTGAAYPRITPNANDNARFSDYWGTNGAFVRVKFIQLGYNIKTPFFTKSGISSTRVYINAQNPLTFSDLKYLDPETRGSDNTYPLMQVYTLGFNVKF